MFIVSLYSQTSLSSLNFVDFSLLGHQNHSHEFLYIYEPAWFEPVSQGLAARVQTEFLAFLAKKAIFNFSSGLKNISLALQNKEL
jgi:hypothetical protein